MHTAVSGLMEGPDAFFKKDNRIHFFHVFILKFLPLFPFYTAVLPQQQIRGIAGHPFRRKQIRDFLNFHIGQYTVGQFHQKIHNQQCPAIQKCLFCRKNPQYLHLPAQQAAQKAGQTSIMKIRVKQPLKKRIIQQRHSPLSGTNIQKTFLPLSFQTTIFMIPTGVLLQILYHHILGCLPGIFLFFLHAQYAAPPCSIFIIRFSFQIKFCSE